MEMRVVRVTDRFDDGCEFYADVLGWPVTTQWDDHGRGRIFGYGDVGRIELLEAGAGDAVSPCIGVDVAIEVDDVQSLYDRMAATATRPSAPPQDQSWGHRSFGVDDPTGLHLVFFQCI